MANNDKPAGKTADEISVAADMVSADIAEVNAASDEANARPVNDAVSYRVLKKGHGLIHTGKALRTETGVQFETFSKGDQVDNVARPIAEALEERGFVEIID